MNHWGQAAYFSGNHSVRVCALPHSLRGGTGRPQNTEVAVDVANTSKTGNDFLADVATLGGADRVRFEPGFGRKGVGSDIHSPERKAASDAEGFPIGKWGGVGMPSRRCGNPNIESRLAKAWAEKREGVFGCIGGRSGKGGVVGEGVGGGDVFDGDIIRDDKLFDSGSD